MTHTDNPKYAEGQKKRSYASTPVTAVQELADAMNSGSEKYGAYSWRMTGADAQTYYDAIRRHLDAWFEGEDKDPQSGVNHLAHVMASCAILLDAQKHGILQDNRPKEPDK